MTAARYVARWLAAACLALVVPAAPAAAQQQPRRAALEQRFRERVAQLVQERLGLDAAQVARLRASNQKFETQRRDLLREERDARRGLRRQLAGGGRSADQQQVARLLDQMLSIHRRRLAIAEAEQRELATFLTPVQRAQYFALQDEVRRRMEELRRRRAAAAPAAPGARR